MGAESSVASAVRKGRRTAHEEKPCERGMRGGREDLSKPPAPSEWSNAVKNCKRLREAFRETVREFRMVVGEGTSLGVGLWCRARQVLHSINQPRRREND